MGLGHRSHPLIGSRVVDTAHNQPGILRAVAPDLDTTVHRPTPTGTTPPRSEIEAADPVAWLAPEGGGREWSTPLEFIRPA